MALPIPNAAGPGGMLALPASAALTIGRPLAFPDPFLLRTKRRFLAFATQTRGVHLQVAASPDLLQWSLLKAGSASLDALPVLPRWVLPERPDVWAPEVIRIGRTYNLYFSARSRTERHTSDFKECIGVATSASPEGPYRPVDKPIACSGLPSGAIDPSPFRDGRKLYLYLKRDGNCCGRGSGVLVQDLSADGLHLRGGRVRTGVRNDQPSEGRVVEAPTMLKREGRYLMFFSAAFYGGSAYAVGYASCRTPAGRCRDAPENPILASRQAKPPRLIGPGHQSILEWQGRTFKAYHAWQALPGGRRGPSRFMHVSEVVWNGGRPELSGLHRPLPKPHWGALAPPTSAASRQ